MTISSAIKEAAILSTGNASLSTSVHPRYFTHLFAGVALDENVARDISGASGHGLRGANLSVAQMNAVPGYYSTIDPASGAIDSRLVLPNLNFDYNGGEKLLIWWLGKVTPEAAATNLLADSNGTAGQGGLRLRVGTDGKMALSILSTAGTSTSITQPTATPFDGTLHSFAVFLNGEGKKFSTWVDGTAFAQSAILGAGAAFDTKNSQFLYLGGDPSTTGAVGTGIASATRALVIVRLASTDVAPTDAVLQKIIQQLRAAPHLLIKSGAL